MVNDLLLLATAERPTTPIATPLTKVVAERVDTWTALAEQSGVAVSLATPDDPVDVMSTPGAIEQILDNLIDNAVQAFESAAVSGLAPIAELAAIAESAPQVHVSVTGEVSTAILRIADNGPGLDPERRERAVERFWRGDRGGAVATTQGSGLGLSIVKGLADASGATTLSSNHDGGLTVAIVFRRASEESLLRPANLGRGPRRSTSKR